MKKNSQNTLAPLGICNQCPLSTPQFIFIQLYAIRRFTFSWVLDSSLHLIVVFQWSISRNRLLRGKPRSDSTVISKCVDD